MGTLWPWMDAHGQQQYSNRLWHSSDDWLVLTGPKCAKKTFPHHYTTATSLDCWHKAGWVHGFMLLAPNSDPDHLYASTEFEIHQTRLSFFQFSTVQFWWAHAHCSLSFLFLADRSGTRRMVFCCCSPSASRFDMLVNSEMLFCSPQLLTEWLSELSLSYLSAWTSLAILRWPLWSTPKIMPWCKITEIIFFPFLMVDGSINWSSWPVSVLLYALHCCNMIA